MSNCKNCGSSDITNYGEMVCNECGAVVESDNIVSEVQFQENAAGSCRMVGEFVSYEDGSGTSRQKSVRNAREKIQNLAYQINLTQYVDRAVRYYKLANGKHLTMGVHSDYVAAACLYIVCRMDQKPVMLLDFSDKIKVDVYTLGRVYRKFADELLINIPFLDPCLYVERYAHKLQFGNKVSGVCRTANRLVASMCRNWMVEGRRPSGICGAALLIAARSHNFNRTISDIKDIFRISEKTIDKRLKEFEQTESSKMTVEEFEQAELKKLSIDELLTLKETMDPPCYSEGIKKAKLEEEYKNMPVLLSELECLMSELDNEVQQLNDNRMKKYMKNYENSLASEATERTEDLSLTSVAPTMEDVDLELSQYEDLLGDMFPNKSNILNESNYVEELEDIMKDNLTGLKNLSLPSDMPSMLFKDSINECLKQDFNDGEGELDLEGIDDSELDEMILDDDEVKIKTLRWMRENADFLREMKEKQEKREQEMLLNPTKKMRKARPSRSRASGFNSTKDAHKQILKEKNISDKINYDKLENFGDLPLKRSEPSPEEFPIKTNTSMMERCSSPPEKKIRLDTTECLPEVQKHEAESEEEGLNENDYDYDDQENQPDDDGYQYLCGNLEDDEYDYNEDD